MTTIVRTAPFVAALCLAFGLAACDEQGPAERTGEAIDEIGEDTRDLGQGPLERTGEEVDEAAEEVGEGTRELTE
ncbi:MAG: hypothetical protein HXY25_05105 [Alphaproteobacteria bacterium]|nr:hypothetical protein [Alphaproteobacteria bacterium]